MKTGIMLPNGIPQRSGAAIAEYAVHAESRGFDSIGVIDRVVYDCLDPLVTLAAAAAATEQIELVTNMLVAPLRNTTMLATQAASLDALSGGRLTLGLGVGIREDDFSAVGGDYRRRGRQFDSQLAELTRIWQGGSNIGPSPVRPGGPRLLVGGDASLAAPRAARWGSGWTMAIGGPEQLAAGVDILSEQWSAAGRVDRPRVMGLLYTAVGAGAEDLVDQAVGSYYAWLGPDLVGWVRSTCAVGESALARSITDFAAAGADDLLLVPCTADLDQLDRIADVALDAALTLPEGQLS